MKTLTLLLVILLLAGIGWFLTRGKQKEEEQVNVRPHTRAVPVRGHSRRKPKKRKRR